MRTLSLVLLLLVQPCFAFGQYPLVAKTAPRYPLVAAACDCAPCTCGPDCTCPKCAVGCGKHKGSAGAAAVTGDDVTYFVGAQSFPIQTQTIEVPVSRPTPEPQSRAGRFTEGCICPCCGMKMTKEQCDKMNAMMAALEASKAAQQAPVVTYSTPVQYGAPMYYSIDANGATSCSGAGCGQGNGGLFGGRGLFGGGGLFGRRGR